MEVCCSKVNNGYETQHTLEPAPALSVDYMLERLSYIQIALALFRDFTFEPKLATQTVII